MHLIIYLYSESYSDCTRLARYILLASQWIWFDTCGRNGFAMGMELANGYSTGLL